MGVPLLVLGLGGLAYSSSFQGQFLLDDLPSIPQNSNLRTLWPLSTTLRVPPELPLSGRPVPTLTFALNYALGGLAVWGYHLVNLVLHLMTACLVFGVIRRTLCRRNAGASAPWLALASTLLWTVHPLLTSSVTYLVQRTELLVGLWMVLTLYAVIRSVDSAHPRRWEGVAIGACAMGMASKEVMVVTPVLVGLYDWLLLASSWRELWRRRRPLYLGLASTWSILAVLMAGHPRPQTAGFGFAALTPWEYLATQAGVVCHYLRLAVWPHPLVADYDDWPVARSIEMWALPGLAMAVLAGLTIDACRRRSAWGFVGAWWLLILAPSSSVVPVITELAAEHRVYLPLLSVVVMVVYGTWAGLQRLVSSAQARRLVAGGISALCIGILGAMTWHRNQVYHTEIGLLRDVIAKRPANTRAHYNLGIALAEQGRLEEAAQQFQAAIRLRPSFAEAHNNLGAVFAMQGRRDDAAAHYQAALRLDPALTTARDNLSHPDR